MDKNKNVSWVPMLSHVFLCAAEKDITCSYRPNNYSAVMNLLEEEPKISTRSLPLSCYQQRKELKGDAYFETDSPKQVRRWQTITESIRGIGTTKGERRCVQRMG
jgi:hypothetical protein